MAKTTMERPEKVVEKYAVALGFYVFYREKGSEKNLLEGMRLRDWTMSGITFDTIDISDQSSMERMQKFATGSGDPGTLTVTTYFMPQSGIHEVIADYKTINEASPREVVIAYNDDANPSGPLIIWLECDAVVQSHSNVSGTHGSVLMEDIVFKLSGQLRYPNQEAAA